MDVVILLVFISLGLVAASLFFFVHRLREGDFDHAERLALAPLSDDPPRAASDDAASAGDSQTDIFPICAPSGEIPLVLDPGGPSSERSQGGSPHARC